MRSLMRWYMLVVIISLFCVTQRCHCYIKVTQVTEQEAILGCEEKEE